MSKEVTVKLSENEFYIIAQSVSERLDFEIKNSIENEIPETRALLKRLDEIALDNFGAGILY